jgi:adenylate cyclase
LRRLPHIAAALLAAQAGALLAETRLAVPVEGAVSDLVYALHARARPAPPSSGQVAVVVLDETTYLRPPLAGVPRALWGPHLARLLDRLVDAGATVVGVDLVLAASAEAVLPGYDRPLLLALRRAALEERVVLAEILGEARPLAPAPVFVFALGGRESIRAVNVLLDADGVARRVPLRLAERATFAAELALRHARAGGTTLDLPPHLRLDPGAAPRPLPSFELADLLACEGEAGLTFLRRHFAGHVVLIGADLADEDRFRTVNRHALGSPHPTVAAGCSGLEGPDDAPLPAPGTLAGVHLQAVAVEQLLTGRLPQEPEGALRFALAAGTALLAALPIATAGLAWTSAAVLLALPLVVLGLALWLLPGVVLPAGAMLLAALVALFLALGWRELTVERARRRLRRAFAAYLPAAEIERLAAAASPPRLGGELREVTVLFADVAGFSDLALRLAPDALVARLNRHFAKAGGVIEAEGGFVAGHAGDALLAVFGAPQAAPDHPARALRAGIALAAAAAVPDGELLPGRIGIASGPVLLGNIGTLRRLSYTVIGDTVNLAARLESLNKLYGTTLLVDASTAAGAGAPLRELDRVRVQGRDRPTTIHTPIRTGEEVSTRAYAAALALYRARDFEAAGRAFAALAGADPPAARMAARCHAFQATPPPPDWDGSHSAEAK